MYDIWHIKGHDIYLCLHKFLELLFGLQEIFDLL